MNGETYRSRMTRKLQGVFAPSLLEIKDDSASHAGHGGHHPLGESHFSIRIVSDVFTGMNAVARHRAVYGALADELKERVHALSLETLTPDEHTHK